MAWSSKNNGTQLTSITTEQFFVDELSLDPGEVVHIQVKIDFPASPTDVAVVAVYSTLDDSSEVWDTEPLHEKLVPNSPDPGYVSFPGITGAYRLRVGVRRLGSTDTLASADLSWRYDGVAL